MRGNGRFFENYYRDMVENIVYVPGTIDKSEEKWNALSPYKPNEIFTIGYAGHPGVTFGKERLDLLVRAVLELNAEGHKCRLRIAGLDKTFFAQTMPDVELNECIECLGKLSHVDCLNMIATSDFSAIIREDKRVTKAGFPTKFSESFGCGTPIIATESSNIFEYLNDGENGIRCTGYSMESIKQGILRAMMLSAEELVQIHEMIKNSNPLEYGVFTEDIKMFFSGVRITNS